MRYYSNYAQHCMRFYARYPHPEFHNEIDKLNWEACDRAMKGFTDDERDILMTVYQKGDTIPDNVYKVSVDRNIEQDTIWRLIWNLEWCIADQRNLI